MRRFWFTLALALLAPASAHALTYRATVNALAVADVTANEYWTSDACDGRVVVHLMKQSELMRLRAAAGDPYVVARADAQPSTCLIRLAYDVMESRTDLCSILTHERGHLHGRGHSTDPRSIMFSGGLMATDPCMRAFTPIHVSMFRSWGWTCAPVREQWQWRCRRAANGEYVYIAAS